MNKSGVDFSRPPPTGLLTYRGGIPTRTSERGITAILRQTAQQTTGALATTLNPVLGNNPSSADNWPDYAAAWSQYRVLGMRIEWQPYEAVNTTGVRTYGAFIHTILHQTAAPSTNSVSNCFSSGDSKLTQMVKPHVRIWKMLDSTEAGWLSTSSPISSSYVYSFFASNLTTSITYGFLFITYYVQFRTTNI